MTWTKRIVFALIGLAVVIQLVPYGRAHDNPAVGAEPAWDSTATRDLAVRACFDCHSNETAWPWYSNVAPMSWLIQHDVDEGRAVLNFSDWQGSRRAHEAGESVLEGQMPPPYYGVIHSTAKLTDAEKRALASGLEATLGG